MPTGEFLTAAISCLLPIMAKRRTPKAIYRQPANVAVAGFVGTPPMNLLPACLEKGGKGEAVVRLGGQVFALAAEWNDPLMKHLGPVIFGIRPEDLFLPNHFGQQRQSIDLEVRVETVEALGAETVFIFKIEGMEKSIFMKADRFAHAAKGDCLLVKIDLSAVSLFDPHTSRVISTLEK